MSNEQSKAIANRVLEEVVNAGNIDRAGEFFTSDYADHSAPQTFGPGLEGLKQFLTQFRGAFPDLKYTVHDTLAEGDLVVQRLTGHGTMTGPFMGMPASGKSASWDEMHISRFGPDDKIVEHWVSVDQLGMLMQLGLAPAPGGM